MGVGLRAGADLVKLLRAEAQHGSARQRQAIENLITGVLQGEQISDLMKRDNKFFPPLMASLVHVGEETGKIETTFLTLADHYDQQLSLRRQFVKSIIWPSIQLVLAIFVLSLVIWLMGILSPPGGGEMTDILGLGLRGESGVLKFWGYIAIVAAFLAAIYFAFVKNVGGVQNLLPVFYMIPKLGNSVRTITLARFTRTLSLALGAGLDPIRSIALGLESTDSEYYSAGAEKAKLAIRDGGQTLAGGLAATNVFPEDLLQMVEISEISGTESESIGTIANEYEERAKIAMGTLSGIATAVVWVTVAAAIIFFIFRIVSVIMVPYKEAFEGL
ncbi:Type II secretion system protein F [Stieleria varia]|uniref:Type II secretion system protein F n=2 Tax=Stieleria varia TaxID=2528005 RepID=A0A5C6B5B8_9BACT|nr:Type II secretion system protein F [Stieleria varia]